MTKILDNHYLNITVELVVLVRCFNESCDYLRESLGSLSVQTFRDFNVLIIDDSTEPKTINFLDNYVQHHKRFILVRHPNRLGRVNSLNYALAHSVSPYIAIFDADDISMIDRFEKQINFLRDNLNIGVVGSDYLEINGSGQITGYRSYPTDHSAIESNFCIRNSIAHPSVMIRRSSINMSGFYNPRFVHCEDLELWLRMLKQGILFANIPEPLVKYRFHCNNRFFLNWYYNLCARVLNVKKKYFLQQILGLVFVFAWLIVPKILKNKLYYLIVSRKMISS